MEIFLRQLDAFSHLDAQSPVGLLLYLGILAGLVLQYHREGTEVFREYARLDREILKEKTLTDIATSDWRQRFRLATHLFGLGDWLVLACILLLLQYVGIMFLLAAATSDKVLVGEALLEQQAQEQARADAQRLLGLAFIAFCVVVTCLMSRAKYLALQTMYDFSSKK